MQRKVHVTGVGMVPFTRPSQSRAYDEMAADATRMALKDAGLDYEKVQHAYVGYIYGDSTSGQAALYHVGATGIPIINVNNNCSTGSTALFMARQAIEAGIIDCALALGFEQMRPGALGSMWNDRPTPMDRFETVAESTGHPDTGAPFAARFFGSAGMQYAETYGTDPKTFAQIAVKARAHAANNPNAVFRERLSLDDVMNSPQIYGILTRYQCCPPTCGAAAAILCSDDFAKAHGLDRSVSILAQALTTDRGSSFEGDMRNAIGFDMAQAAADAVYESAGVAPTDIPVVELHDCFTANELLSYEALRLTPAGTAEKFIWDGDNTYGGRVVTNPSGGLLSKGHPIGATGLAQCAELTWQLRGQATGRQVEGANLALQHNLGLGGACVVTLYGANN
ncbi:MAG: lipid-transfer protein [Nocardioidaceae bacterium]